MTPRFPPAYTASIDQLLGAEAPRFWEAMQAEPASGIRIHPGKTSREEIETSLEGKLTSLPWAQHGFCLETTQQPGKHPYHGAGLYYLQEPSAMAPAAVLDPQPGERVLDLCAAPGGKTTQLNTLMADQGILIANDPNPGRVEALARNLERWGARSAAVVSESPLRLSEHFGAYFDRVLVDAPCSGEGTFRSDPGQISKWSLSFRERLAALQDEILWYAGKLVRPGGKLVYSTCTFNPEENEGSISRFLESSPEFSLAPIPRLPGYSPGIALPDQPGLDHSRMVRIWPHTAPGEGHFIALLQKSDQAAEAAPPRGRIRGSGNPDPEQSYQSFFQQTLRTTAQTHGIQPGSPHIARYGNRLYWIPEHAPSLKGLTVTHWGWWLGTFRGDRFQPGPALASSLSTGDAQIVLEFAIEDPRLQSYLRGSPLAAPSSSPADQGWALAAVEGHTLGWGRLQGGRFKSYYPRWLRSS